MHSLANLSLERLQADDAGDAAKAALSMLGGETPAAVARRFSEIVSEHLCADGADEAGGSLYDLAVALDDYGSEQDAIVVLAVLSANDVLATAGLLGLSVIALRRGLIKEAANLVAPCLLVAERHPRACSVAGICALEASESTAQAHLAAASRIGRRSPALREELKIAQRALLLMHLR